MIQPVDILTDDEAAELLLDYTTHDKANENSRISMKPPLYATFEDAMRAFDDRDPDAMLEHAFGKAILF